MPTKEVFYPNRNEDIDTVLSQTLSPVIFLVVFTL